MSKAAGPLKIARKLLRARKFFNVITLLEQHEDEYRDSIDFYYYLGTACLYQDDRAGANSYFDAARRLTVSDQRIILAQAALFLRRGETDRAINYYLDVLDIEPKNKIALKALDVIEQKSKSTELLHEFISGGGAKKFYPSLVIHPFVKFLLVLVSVLLVGYAGFLTAQFYSFSHPVQPRADLSAFALSVDQRNNALQEDLSGEAYHYIMNARQVNETYDAARSLFQQHRDNAAQIEINRILHSNASTAIKQNVRMLMDYLQEPTFDSFTDNISYLQVIKEPHLYVDCWVVWKGRITNAQSSNEGFTCDLLVGYENLQRVEGIVPLVFQQAMDIDATLPLQVLGRIGVREDGKLFIQGKSVYQPRDGSSL